ncbi:basic region leucin zipper [Klebsormidium nitens]|uniref:Basic region leucin zipper n=1 Tax=Klebsormidium nitens TaxID=105231 RepID=A0A1Y1I6Q6_KLENI|nr:basic region leucin zipper [Klebsormidium nitens]|eukprot:GAQ85622.1 basic region leucin zipper [Klebsormidium nitens]
MAAQVKEDPEAGLVGADGDGEWMEELLQSHGAETALEELPCSLDFNLFAAPWATPLSSSLDEAALADPFPNLDDSWGLRCEGPDLDGMLQVLAASPRAAFEMHDARGDETGACRIDVQESQESNKVQESGESSQANSSNSEDKGKAESSGGSPASSSGDAPLSSAVKRPLGVKTEKESDSDSDNCAGNRPVVEQGDVEKLQERLMRNRESAQLSRQRKKAYMEEMASRIRSLSTTVSELNTTIAHLSAENASLRHQLAFYLPPGTAPPLPAVGPPYMAQTVPGMRPLYPAPGPIAYGGYPGVMRPGYAPPVPIPRLSVQSAASAKKATTKRGTSAKSKAKDAPDGTKQPASKRMKLPGKAAAGISAMALFCFAMVIAPASWHTSELTTGTAVQPAGFEGFGVPGLKAGGRVLMSLPEGNGSVGAGGAGKGHGRGGSEVAHGMAMNGTTGEGVGSTLVNSSLVWQQLVNASSPFSVPPRGNDAPGSQPWVLSRDRSGKVEGDRSQVSGVVSGIVPERGDWIRNAVVVEARRAAGRIVADVALRKSATSLMTSQEHERLKGIATLALAGRAETTRHAALPAAGAALADEGSGFDRYPERQTSNMWSFSGAPFLSSAMCTELFQFADPAVVNGGSGREARAAAEEAALAVAREQSLEGAEAKEGVQKQNQTASLRGMGRKWKPKNPDAVPMPPVNGTRSQFDAKAEFEDEKQPERCEEGAFGCKNASSSVVVSVMVPQVGWERSTFEPKKGASTSKGLGQIFVVVLINSAKYVTYSCSVPSVA